VILDHPEEDVRAVHVAADAHMGAVEDADEAVL